MRAHPSRRQLLAMAGAGALLPRPLWARRAADGRRFLFLFCKGGWDTSYVFTDPSGVSGANVEDGAEPTVMGGLPLIDHPDRPAVRAFFEQYASRCCVINGLEVPSITHERCTRIVLTGSAEQGTDDWGAHIAANTGADALFPHVVLAGPAFTHAYGDRVVRVGVDGQLPDLLTGTALAASDRPVLPLTDPVAELAHAHVARRAAAAAEAASGAQPTALLQQLSRSLAQLDQARELGGAATLAPADAGCERDIAADADAVFELFEMDLARSAMLESRGWCAQGWDTHQDNPLQSLHLDGLFGYLSTTLAALDTRSSPSGGALADDVTIVVFSEMGRHPQLNTWGGKDHWTWTSAMLIGAGVQGGRVIGGLDDQAVGLPIDLASGDTAASGQRLSASHLGATLLHMAGIDPAEAGLSVSPILGALQG